MLPWSLWSGKCHTDQKIFKTNLMISTHFDENLMGFLFWQFWQWCRRSVRVPMMTLVIWSSVIDETNLITWMPLKPPNCVTQTWLYWTIALSGVGFRDPMFAEESLCCVQAGGDVEDYQKSSSHIWCILENLLSMSKRDPRGSFASSIAVGAATIILTWTRPSRVRPKMLDDQDPSPLAVLFCFKINFATT